MAKKKATNGELKFDPELDFTMDDVDVFGSENTKKSRNPVMEVFRGVGNTVKNKAKSASFWDSVARKALPKDYSFVSDEFSKARTTLSDIYRDSAKSLRPELSKIGKQVNLLVPEESKRLKNITKKLAGSNNQSSSSPSAEMLQNVAIGQGLDDVFGKVAEQNNQREIRDRVESRIKDKIDTKRFTASINILGGVQEGMARMASYTTTVNAAFQKKSLELQYRSYFVQAELLKTSDLHYKKAEAYYEAIKHNTALPDFVKITASERFKELGINKFFSSIQSGLGAVLGRVKTRIGGLVSEATDKLGTLGSGLDGIQMYKDSQESMKEMGMDDSPYKQGGGLLAEMLMSGALGKYGEKLSKLFPRDGKVAQMIFRLAQFVRDPNALAKQIRGNQKYKDALNAGGVKGGLARTADWFMQDLVTPDHDKEINKGRKMGLHQEAFFDRRVYHSITEVIPGYLSRILQVNTASMMGRQSVNGLDLQHFDWKREKFSTVKKIQEDSRQDILNGSQTKSMDYQLSQAVKAMTGQSMGGADEVRIKRYLHKMMTSNRADFTSDDTDNMIDAAPSNELTDSDKKLMKDQLAKLRQKGEQGKSFINHVLSTGREGVQMQINEIKNLLIARISEGYGPQLEAAGLVVQNEKSNFGYDVNLKAVVELVRTGGVTAGTVKPEAKKSEGADLVNRALNRDGRGSAPLPSTEELDEFGNIVGTSDRNVKTQIRSKTMKNVLDKFDKLKTFGYRYLKRKDDGKRHEGYMAQDVNKHFGEEAAPDGTKVDHSYMNAQNTEGIKELHKNQKKMMKDPTSIDLLKSIDRRLADITSLSRFSIDLLFDGETASKVYSSGIDIARDYGRATKKKMKKGADFVSDKASNLKNNVKEKGKSFLGKVMSLFGMAGNTALGVGKGAVNFTKDMKTRHGGKVYEAGQRVFGDMLSLISKTYDFTKNVATNIIPSALKSVNGMIGNLRDRTKEFFSKPKDLYHHSDSKNPIIRADMMAKGEYIDKDGTAILNLDQLKKLVGSLYVKSTGNVQVTEEQFKDGLIDINGQKLKFMVTGLKDVVTGTVGWVGGRLAKGLGRIKGLFNRKPGQEESGSFMGRLFSGIGNGLSGILGAGKGAFGKLGFGGSKDVLEDILKLLKKWDEKGLGTGGDKSSLGDLGSSGTSTISPELLQDAAGGGGGGTAPGAAAASSPTGGMGIIGKGIGAVKGLFGSSKVQNGLASARSAIGSSKLGTKVGNIFGAGKARLGGMFSGKLGRAGGMFGKFGSKLGKLGGGLIGGAAGLVGSLLGGSNPTGDPTVNQTGPQAGPSNSNGDKTGLLARLLNGMKKVPENIRKWNDRDGSGRRDGSYLDGLEKIKDNHKLSDAAATPDAAKYTDGSGFDMLGKLGGIFGMLSGGIGSLFTSAKGLLLGGKKGDKLKAMGAKALSKLGKFGKLGKFAAFVGTAGAGMLGFDLADGEEDPEAGEEGTDGGINPADAALGAAGAAGTAGAAGGAGGASGKRPRSRSEVRARAARMRASRAGRAGGAPRSQGRFAKLADYGSKALTVLGKGRLWGAAAPTTGAAGAGRAVGGNLLKGLMKQIPGFGTILGLGFGSARALKGDFLGAGLEVASTIPGFGLAAQAALVGLDIKRAVMPGAPVPGAAGTPGAPGAPPPNAAKKTFLQSVLSSKTVIGKIALGMAGFGIYKVYKYLSRDQLDEYQKIRFMQYGIPPSKDSYNHMLANLEAYLVDKRVGFRKSGEGDVMEAYLLESKIDSKELLGFFDLDPDDETAEKTFTTWFQDRFKPFFLTAVTAMFAVNPKLKLTEVSKLKEDELVGYLKGSLFESGPYSVTTAPTKDISECVSNKEAVKASGEQLLNKALKASGKKEANKYSNVLTRTLAPAEPSAEAAKTLKETGKYYKVGEAAGSAAALAYSKTLKMKNGVAAIDTVGPDDEHHSLGKGGSGANLSDIAGSSTISSSSSPKLAGGTIMGGDGGMQFIKLASRNVKLEGLNPSVLRNFLGMAEEYGKLTGGKSIMVNSAYRSKQDQERVRAANPGKAARPGSSAHEFGLALDIQSGDADALDKLGLMKKYGFTRPVGKETWHVEPAGIQKDLAAAKNSPSVAAMMTDAGLFKGGGGYGTLPNSIKNKRDKALQLALLGMPGGPTSDTSTQTQISEKLTSGSGRAPVTEAANDSGYNPVLSSNKSDQRTVDSSFAAANQNKAFNLSTNNKFTMGSTDEGEKSSLGKGSSDAGGTEQFATDRAGVLKAIETYSSKTGVSATDLQTIAAIESSLDPTAKAGGGSSAAGLFGFTSRTWNATMNQHGGRYGLSGNETPNSIKASTLLAGELIKTSAKSISSVKPNPNLTDTYLAHFLGAAGARKFFQASPSDIGANVLPNAAAKNRTFFYDNSGRARTISEIYAFTAEKLKKAQKDFGITGGNIPSVMKPTGATLVASAPTSSGSSNIGQSIGMSTNDPVTQMSGNDSINRKSIVTSGPEEISMPAMVGTSNRASERQPDVGASAMGDMVSISKQNLNINRESLDTMKEIRDMIKQMVDTASSSKGTPSPTPKTQPPPRVMEINPLLEVGRKRNYRSA